MDPKTVLFDYLEDCQDDLTVNAGEEVWVTEEGKYMSRQYRI